jgi:hypothetical protein
MSILFESHTEELTDFVFNDEVITNFGSVIISTEEFFTKAIADEA